MNRYFIHCIFSFFIYFGVLWNGVLWQGIKLLKTTSINSKEVPDLKEFSNRLIAENWTSVYFINNDSCMYSKDKICDEGTYCEMGTDKSDCEARPRPVLAPDHLWVATTKCKINNYKGIWPNFETASLCKKHKTKIGCSSGRWEVIKPVIEHRVYGPDVIVREAVMRSPCVWTPENPKIIHTCLFKNDGKCDEGTYCSSGTDFNDCCEKEGVIKKELTYSKTISPTDEWVNINPLYYANCGHIAWLYRSN